MMMEVPSRIQLDKKSEKSPRHLGIDVACRFVREEKLRLRDHRPGDCGPLLLSAGQNGGESVHPVAEAHPFQKLGDVLLVIALLAAHHSERKRHILPRRKMVEQPEVLKYDADASAKIRALPRRILGNISSEKVYEAARGAQRHIQEPEKSGFAGARGACQEVERTRLQMEVDIAQNLLPDSISESDILELYKSVTRYHNLKPCCSLLLALIKRTRSSN